MNLPTHRRWNAKWIWLAGDGPEPNTHLLFRKEITLQRVPDKVSVFITADTRYQLYVNGTFVGRGSAQSQPFYQYYDERDITAHLVQGTNAIGIIVEHTGRLADSRGGLLCEITSEAQPLAATDNSWKAMRAQAWRTDTQVVRGNQMTPYQEHFDAGKMPEGWTAAGFDDAAWQNCVVLAGRVSDTPPAVTPWTKLVPRDIPFMAEYAVKPVRIETIEESLDLVNRSRPGDLAPGLSMVGKPLAYSHVENAQALLSGGGVMTVQSSTQHRNLDFDGKYAPAIVLDFGKVITARARVQISASRGGTIDIGYAERLIDGNFNIAMECEFADRYVMKEGAQVFTAFDWKGFRYLKLRFRSCEEPVSISAIEGLVSAYPFEERGAFTCNDDTLNRIFTISRDTIRLCSNEYLMDTPWREQAQWLGDVALVTVPAIYACFGELRLAEKFIRQAALNQHQTGMISNVSNTMNHRWQGAIPDYSLWWLSGLWYHYQYTGQRYWIDRFYPEALRIIHAHLEYINERGLIEDMPYWPFIDWANVDKRGECAAYNAIFYGALQSLRNIAEVKNDTYAMQLADDLRARMKASFQQRFFDPERRALADACIRDNFSPLTSEQANGAALAFGLLDDATAKTVIEAVFEKKTALATEAQPFFMTVVLAGLDRNGRMDLALKLTKDRWGKRMVERGLTSVLEEWYMNGSWRSGQYEGFLRTHSHAWSACPADFLIRNLMGLTILTPGCTRVRLKPVKTAFDYSCTFPTPAGNITVENKQGALRFSADPGITIET